MALVQMHNYGNTGADVAELKEQIEVLTKKLEAAENSLADVTQQRDTVIVKIQEAVEAIEQRDNSIKKIEEQVKLLHSLAENLKKENTNFKADNERLHNDLKGKQDELSEAISERDKLQSHDDILAKMDEVEEDLKRKLTKLKRFEKTYFDDVLKAVGRPADESYKIKLMATMNSVETHTANLHNYNDSRVVTKLELMDNKLNSLVTGNRVGLLCGLCVLIGIVAGILLLKLL